MKKLSAISIIGSLFLFLALGLVFAAAPKKTPELLAQGKKLFEQNCSACHGSNGDGKGPAGAALKPSPTDFTKPLKEWPNTKGDANKIFEVISKGIPGSAMVKWDQFSEQERWGLVYTVMDFSASSKTPAKKK